MELTQGIIDNLNDLAVGNSCLHGDEGTDTAPQWLIAVDCPVLFAASIAACWISQRIPVVSADLQSDTLLELCDRLNGMITDRDIQPIGLPAVRLPMENTGNKFRKDVTASGVANPSFAAEKTALVLFTSGSTGKKKRISKPFFALFEEIMNLERNFGAQVQGLPRRTTVSHFHIYGFLFNILWPLHFGHLLCDDTTFYWEQILHDGNDGACIVSSPPHLRVLPAVAGSRQFNWQRSVIFSSGGPLARDISLEIRSVTGIGPVEIFGSTETGGVAFRRQHPETDTPFTPFSPVKITQNDRDGLLVQSPWLLQADGWVETGDRIDILQNGQFLLKGRYDTIAKIAGKRVSLTEMEQFLSNMPEVAGARVFQYIDESQRGRGILAAVIIPTSTAPLPSGTAKQQLVKTIREQMKRRFDLVTLPRYWRFVPDFPRNAEGKVPLALLEETVRNGH